MRILVTGASGYVGRACCSYFRTVGYEVTAATKSPEEGTIAVGDIGAQTDWRGLLAGVEVVVHCAALVHKPNTSVAEYQRVNVDAVERLAKQAAEAGVRCFVQLSSAAVYGDYKLSEFTEDSITEPNSAYGLSKLRAEERLGRLESHMQRLVLRCPMIYGPGAPGNYSLLIRLLHTRLPLPFSDMSNRRSFLSVGNLAQVIVRLIESEIQKQFLVLNVTEKPHSTSELLCAIADSCGARVRFFRAPRFVFNLLRRVGGFETLYQKLYGDYVLSDALLEEVLAWKPSSDVRSNMARDRALTA